MSKQKFNILVIDDESDITDLLQDILEDKGYQVFTANHATEGDKIYYNQPINLVLLDIWMPEEDGISLLKRWHDHGLQSEVIIMSGHGNIETAVQATKLGAYDFIEKPISLAKLMINIENVFNKITLEQRKNALIQQINPEVQIIGKSTTITSLKKNLAQIQSHNLPVFFIGESGSGKIYYSRYLHQISERKNEPFIVVNASALSRKNQKQAIFGGNGKRGLIETAEGGTLHIDEITDLDFITQSFFSLLIKTGRYKIDNQIYSPNVRLCFSSQYSLTKLKENDLSKKDLHDEALSITINIPSLKSYQDDIPSIIRHYVYYFVDYDKLPYRQFSMPALNFLRQYDWPGNVRELKNFIQRVLVLSEKEEVDLDAVKKLIDIHHPSNEEKGEPLNIDLPIRDARENFEKSYFIKQLNYCNGNIAKLAERAGLERTNLYRKLKSLGIQYK